jgi:hypothetical protein
MTDRQPTRINVTVTEKDIENAHRNNSYACVVAQAVARTVKDATRIEVDTQSIRFTRNGRRLIYLTPYAVQGYIIAFDAGDPLEPFSFQLRQLVKNPRQSERTEAGKVVHRAADRARRRAKRRLEAETDLGDVSLTQPSPKEAATAAYQEAKAAVGNVLLRRQRGRPVPRVFKRKTRSYGHRLLRINREEAKDWPTILPKDE